jgi:hypothetical protein
MTPFVVAKRKSPIPTSAAARSLFPMIAYLQSTSYSHGVIQAVAR